MRLFIFTKSLKSTCFTLTCQFELATFKVPVCGWWLLYWKLLGKFSITDVQRKFRSNKSRGV